LAAIAAGVRLLVSEDGLPSSPRSPAGFREHLGVDVAITPGRYDAYHEYPYELAEAVRPLLA
jgi:hypothetical protein